MKWLIILFLFLPMACASGTEGVVRLNADQFEAKLKSLQNVILIDVRTPEEFAQGYIPGAQLINIYDPDFQQKISALPNNQTVMVYCRSGNRSMQAVPALQKAGFKEIYELYGGMNAWYSANKMVKK
jgi:rhodanese-related sulfurtransferase